VRMRAAARCHAGMVRELATLQTTVSSVAELVLGHLPDETSLVEIMNEGRLQISEDGGIVLVA
jgi:hypothetical protein